MGILVMGLEFYLPYPQTLAAFGSHWIHEGAFPHAERVLVAHYAAVENCEGHDVEVYVSAWPAQFFTLIVKELYQINFGSGDGVLCAKIAEEISRGMLKEKHPPTG